MEKNNTRSRRTGRSTRLIDKAIQDLFKKKEVVIKDHFDDSESNKQLFYKVLKRIDSEHPSLGYAANPKTKLISLLNYE